MSSPPNYRSYRFPAEIISHTVWLYHKFTLSLRDIENLMAERNIISVLRIDQAAVRRISPCQRARQCLYVARHKHEVSEKALHLDLYAPECTSQPKGKAARPSTVGR